MLAGAAGYLVRSESTVADLDRAIRYSRVEAERRRECRDRTGRFQALAESISETVILTDPDGTVLYASPPVEALLGQEAQAFEGRNAFELIHPDDRERALHDFTVVVEGGDLPGPTDFRVVRSDGSCRTVAASGRNLLRNPSVNGIVVTLRDVTERHELEERLLHA
jgi:PAS domain S-box-containing protein